MRGANKELKMGSPTEGPPRESMKASNLNVGSCILDVSILNFGAFGISYSASNLEVVLQSSELQIDSQYTSRESLKFKLWHLGPFPHEYTGRGEGEGGGYFLTVCGH